MTSRAEKITEKLLQVFIVLMIIFSGLVVYESKEHADRIGEQKPKCVKDMFNNGCD